MTFDLSNERVGEVCLFICLLYTGLNSPSPIFTLQSSEIDSPSLEYAQPPILLYNPLYIIQLAQFKIRPQVGGRKGQK